MRNLAAARSNPADVVVRLGAATLAVLLAAGCSRASDDDSTPDPPSATEHHHRSRRSMPLPSPIADTASRSSLEDSLVDTISLPGNPDWLALAGRDLWVKRDDGQVSRIRPQSGRVLATLSTRYSGVPACDGLTNAGGVLWSCSGDNRLVTLDPRTNQTGRTVRVSRLSDQTRFVPSQGQMWVINGNGTELSGLSLRDGSVESTVELGRFCTDLARATSAQGHRIFVVCPTDGLVLAVDTASVRVTGELPLEDPREATVADDLWVGFAGGLAQVNPDDLAVVAVYEVTTGLEAEIWADGTDVWVRAPGTGMLTHLDADKRRVDVVLTSSRYRSDGDVLISDNFLWTTASDDGVLLKIALPISLMISGS